MNKAITHEEFLNYKNQRSSLIEKKNKRSDLLDAIYAIKKQLMAYELSFDQLQEEIDIDSDNLTNFIEDLGIKYELGVGVYNFSETEPHIITEVN